VDNRSPPGDAAAWRRHWPPPGEMTFTTSELPEVRRFTAGWASQAGMSADSAADFVIAVSEIATNAVRYGLPPTGLRLQATGRTVTAEIRDNGRWRPGTPPVPWNRGGAGYGGLGLRIACQVCEDVRIRTSGDGTAVVLRMALT
jgi:anti-sigma regulatory factor (Ser/Thr protein kinase)